MNDGISISSTREAAHMVESEAEGESSVQGAGGKMYLGSFDEQNPTRMKTTKDSICMYDEDQDNSKKASRKASLSSLPDNMIDIYKEEEEQIVNSRVTRSGRRSSYTVGLPQMGPPCDGYGPDDEDVTQLTPRAASRRASLRNRNSTSSGSPREQYEKSRRRGSTGVVMEYHGSNGSALAYDGSNIATRRGSTGQVLSKKGGKSRRSARRRSLEYNQKASSRASPVEEEYYKRGKYMSRGQPKYNSHDEADLRESGFNEEVLHRMNNPSSAEYEGPEEDDDSDSDMNTYSNPYGYAPRESKLSRNKHSSARSVSMESTVSSNGVATRRGSCLSYSSGVLSRRGRNYKAQRGGACLIQTEIELPSPNEQILLNIPQAPASNRERDDDHQASYSTGFSTYYGYESGESDGQRSLSSRESIRSRRRNSYLHRPEKESAKISSLLEGSRQPEIILEPDEETSSEPDDLKDPDSLLSRSGFHKKNVAAGHKSPLAPVTGGVKGSNVSFAEMEVPVLQEDDLVLENSEIVKSAPLLKKRDPEDGSGTEEAQGGGWNRPTPFTTSKYEQLTAAKLAEAQKNAALIAPEIIPSNSYRSNRQLNWGELDLDSTSHKSSDSGIVSNLYEDSPIVQEIDRYKQRARRRESLEQTVVRFPIDTGASIISKNKDVNFTPAKGCTNASDFIVRCFMARLRQGITVWKHNRSRWSKSSTRELFLVDNKTLSWRRTDGEMDKGRRPKLDLTKCCEVRHAFTKDPSTRKQTGTATLRKRCKDGSAAKSLSLIFGKRTLDMTAVSNDQCKVLMEGFSALCFRLQLEALRDESVSQSDARTNRYIDSKSLVSEDWASTVFTETVPTISVTHTSARSHPANPSPNNPWGL